MGKAPIKEVGIRELKNNLSRYLSRVKRGETIMISQHGRIIARITAEGAEPPASLRERLAPLAAGRLAVLPEKELIRNPKPPIAAAGESAAQRIIEERR